MASRRRLQWVEVERSASVPGVDADEGGSAKNMVIIVANQASSTGRRYRPATVIIGVTDHLAQTW